ncbi:hypothetical protein LAV_00141 [Sphingobium phage Lacusarx]|uniref:Uncharacterized protein n=1 Tax=Sphingobium phage Lacusarx TaxID=1980139 RepID=A0A1W6DXD0_9CAUD|nr:hypothetical protein FDH44_gp162 [Sphingobium phage Lacusarx]ARK07516.1 hypothetical protein LAV_00141 [Sphingobium phage Lacusarx]
MVRYKLTVTDRSFTHTFGYATEAARDKARDRHIKAGAKTSIEDATFR